MKLRPAVRRFATKSKVKRGAHSRIPDGWCRLVRMCKSLLNYLKLSLLDRGFGETQVIWCAILVAWSCYLWIYITATDLDPMSLTTIVAFVVGMFYSLMVDRDQYWLCKQLNDDTIFRLDESRLPEFRSELRRVSRKMQRVFAVVWLLLFIAGYYIAQYGPSKYVYIMLACSVMMGLRFGRGVANGCTGWVVKRYLVDFQVLANHPDRAGGLALIGNFYLKQASVMLVPVGWSAAWIIMTSGDHPVEAFSKYGYYREWLPLLWCLLITCTAGIGMSFWFPLSFLQRYIVAWKRAEKPHIEKLRRELRHLKNHPLPDAVARERIMSLTEQVHSFTYLSNWCLSPSVRTAVFSGVLTLTVSAIISFVLTIASG